MKRIIFFIIISTIFLIPCAAQEEKQENIVCSELKTASLTVANDEILVAGKVSFPQIVKVRKQVSSLAMYLAWAGGKKRENKNVIVFNCSSNTGKAENVIFVDYDKLRKSEETDLEMKGGDIIFVLSKDDEMVPSVSPAFKPRFCGVGRDNL